eukprot:3212408-Prymnesium_polylepis.1
MCTWPSGKESRSQSSSGTASLLTPRSWLLAEAMSPATSTMARATASVPSSSCSVRNACSQK